MFLIPPARKCRRQVLAIHPRDDVELDALGTRGRAFAVERAAAEPLAIRRGHEGARAAHAFLALLTSELGARTPAPRR